MGLMARLRGEEPGIIKQFLASSVLDDGEFGEWLAFYALRHGKLGGNGYVLRNVLVPRESGPTTTSEIDVLLLHEKGIFVLESKNYSGWIFGSADQRQWTKSLPGGHKERFYNPSSRTARTFARWQSTSACPGRRSPRTWCSASAAS